MSRAPKDDADAVTAQFSAILSTPTSPDRHFVPASPFVEAELEQNGGLATRDYLPMAVQAGLKT